MRTKKIEEPTYLQYKKYAKGGELKDVESTAKAFVAKDYDGLTKQQRQKKLANDLGWDTYEEMANDDTVDNKYARADVTENGENAGMIADIDYALNQSDFEEAQNIFDELNKKVESLLSKEQTPPELKDVESTAKALEKINLYEINENFINDFQEKILEKFDEEKISNIQYLRHELHSESPKNIFYSESNDFDNKIEEVANNISELDITGKENEVSKKIINFYDYESGNRKSESSFEYEEDMEHDDYYNLAYSEISEEKEKINKIIEEYLFDLDEIWDNYNLSEISDIRKNKTFAPSGYMRARSILGKESLSNIKYKKFDNKIIYKISEAYHSAKADGSNPKLVKEVEKVLSNNYAKGGELNTYKNKYNRKYGYPENESHNLEQISKDTGVSLKGLQQIYNKGIGAYKTNPESVRKNVHSKEQWAMGRVYSAVMGGKASKVDSNELKMENGGELDYITQLEKEYNSKSLDELMAINKKLYSKVDIESAMSAEEKLLKKIIAKKFSDINQQIIERRRLKKLEKESANKMAKGGEIQSMINEGIVEIEFYDTTIAHAKEYGIESKKPLYLKRIFVSENNRNKGLGKKLIKYLYDFAVENGNDVIFGHIATKSSYKEILKHLLPENGYTINDKNNDFYIMITKENKYNTGGDLKKSNIISLPDTYSSYDSLKPILENQGYELIKKNNLEMSTEKLEIEDNRSVSELDMKYPELPHSFINKQLMSGIEHEMEHTEDPRVAKKIAIDHLLENIHYYEYLAEMEQKMQGKNIDEHYESITKMYEEGGKVETFEFSTPTGKTSKLNYLQQVLVRTKAFKNFFGDWELAARNYQNGKLDFYEAYKNVSKCIDDSTLEPRVVYHGTQADKEFFTFDVTQEKKIGRPYAYFAYNRQYSLNFSGGTNKGYMYAVFLNIRNPFNASGETFLKNRDSSYWLTSIKGQISLDKYGDVTKRKELSDTVDSQIKSYIEEVYTNQPYYFWLLMARDVNKEFKYFLMSHGYDGIFASENFTNTFDTENPSEFTYTYIAFDANQIKLADGRNIDFDPMNADIRYEEGGKTVEKVEIVVEQQEPTQNIRQIDYLRNNLRKFSEKDAEINQTIFKSGGHVQKDSGSPDDAKDGGLFVGRSHATGGIKAINLSTNQPIEVEGGEVIITKPAVEDQTKREFEGKMMTNKEILSYINQSGGGVSFEKGGEMGNSCGCSGKMYKFGGETISDYMVLRKISTIYDESIKNVKNYVDNLSEQFK
jgi:GNAT superfamily N-acetyltransferase